MRPRRCLPESVGWRVALALAGCAALSAPAQRAHAPDLRVGDEWRFVVYYAVASTLPNKVWRVESIGPAQVELSEGDARVAMTPELNVLDSPRARETNPRQLSFPLEVGKEWRYSSDWFFKPKNANGSTAYEVRVVAFEKVAVPAGEFDAFKLVSTGRISGKSPIGSIYDGEARATYWYAPAARAIVKSVAHNTYLGASTTELVEYRLAR